MPGPEFFQTAMGQRFYEGTMPALVRAIQDLNKNLGTILDTEIAAEAGRRRRDPMVADRSALASKVVRAIVADDSFPKMTEIIAGRMIAVVADALFDGERAT